ncbi:MAG: oligosaccharide flippase family protein [bacterium]
MTQQMDTQHRTGIWRLIARNVFSNFSGVLASTLTGFFLLPYILGHIGKNDYGVWVLAAGVLGHLGLLEFGLSKTVVIKASSQLAEGKDASKLREITDPVFTVYAFSGLCVIVVVAALAAFSPGWFGIAARDTSKFRLILWIAGINTALAFPMSVWDGLVKALQDFHYLNAVRVFSNVVRILGTVALLSRGAGVVGLVLLHALISVIVWILNIAWVRFRLGFAIFPAPSLKSLKRHGGVFQLSSSIFFIQTSSIINNQTDKIILGIFGPVSWVAVYEVGNKINTYLRGYINEVLGTITPAASSAHSRGEPAVLREMFMTGTKLLLCLTGVVAMVFIVYSREFMMLWVGEGYELSVAVLLLLLMATLYEAQGMMGANILVSMERVRFLVYLSFLAAGTNLVLSLLLVKHHGILGVAAATLITYFISTNILIFHICRNIRVDVRTFMARSVVPAAWPLPAAALVFTFLKNQYPVHTWADMVVHAIGLAGSLIAVYALFSLTSRERQFFIGLIRRKKPE